MSESGQFEYRTLHVSVRPSRHVIGYPADDHWIATARRVIASQCRYWAGANSVILPVDRDGKCDDLLVRVLPKYDPDYVHRYVRTLSDFATLAPAAFERLAERNRGDDETVEETKDRLLRYLADDPLPEPNEWDQFAAQVARWCAPHVMIGLAGGEPDKIDMGIISPGKDPAPAEGLLPPDTNEWLTLDLDGVPAALALMIESRIGQLDPNASHGLRVARLPINADDYPALASLAITGKLRWWPKLTERYRQAVDEPSRDLDVAGLLSATPFARTRQWTAEVRDFETAPMIIVAGDQASDHALALLCDRIFDNACWLPVETLRGTDEAAAAVRATMHTLWNDWAMQSRRGDSPICLTSTSLTVDELDDLAREMQPPYADQAVREDGPPEPWMQCITVDDISRLGGHRWLTDPQYASTPMSVPARVNEGAVEQSTPLMAPLPMARTYLGEQLRWQTDVTLPGHQLPQMAGLPRELLSADTPGAFPEAHVRTGRLGLCYSSNKAGLAVFGSGPEWSVARPRLRFPSAVTVFEVAARRKNATVRLSAAGRRASLAIHKCGSLDELINILRGSARKLLDAFTPPKKTGNFAYATGYCIRRKGYVSFADAAKVTGDDARGLLDRLSDKALVRRGFILSCERCRWEDFIPLSQLADMFTCQACGAASRLAQGQWDITSPEPTWFYDLDQIIRDLLDEHGDVPLLAIDLLRQNARSVLYCPELEIVLDGQTQPCAETDICLIVDGLVVVGEAKSNNQLDGSPKRSANKIVKAAEILGADRLILATTTGVWAPSVRPAVDAALNSAEPFLWRAKPIVEEIVNVA